MAYKFQVGDKVRVVETATDFWGGCDSREYLKKDPKAYLVLTAIGEKGDFSWECFDSSSDERRDRCSGHSLSNDDFILFGAPNINGLQTQPQSLMQNLLTSFTNLFVSEPQKSFLKAGITDQNGNVTPEGNTVFTTWLLKQNATAFKTEVVDPLIAQIDEAKK